MKKADLLPNGEGRLMTATTNSYLNFTAYRSGPIKSPYKILIMILSLSTNKGVELIDVSGIVRIKAISNYSKLYFASGKTLVVAKVLRWFEEQLPPTQFIRPHRTHLVNKLFVQHYLRSGKMQLSTGTLITIARRKKRAFNQQLQQAA